MFDLPSFIDEPLEVFVNGILQQPERDYRVVGGALVFPRPLAPERKMTRIQLALATLGIAGTYPKQELVDVVYERDGRRLVATALPPRRVGR